VSTQESQTPQSTEQKSEDAQPWMIDHVYKVVRLPFPIGEKGKETNEFPYVEHTTKEKRQVLLDIVNKFENARMLATEKNSDVLAIEARDELHNSIIKTCLPSFPISIAENDERLGPAMLFELQKDLRSFFLVIGGTQGLKLLQSRVSLMQSMQANPTD